MYDIIRKPWLWDMLDRGLLQECGWRGVSELKATQDIAVYDLIKDARGQRILEAGGGRPRILPYLARHNECINLDRFDGTHGGPEGASEFEGIENRMGYLGERDPALPDASIDIIFSISVVEHIPTESLQDFLEDGLRLLKPGGRWVHAIDIYVENEPNAYYRGRYDQYRNWFADGRLVPIGDIHQGPLGFSCDMATNPDGTMHIWGTYAPALIDLRKQAQCVSIILAGTKRED
ncbi:class I SAM-dependent methyltransferase [Niveispirillum irakense]|uniref:class I SAM-dependent methyltransferase n=1 Tax=Niveispirillum irakense TaxID=34011 RepID=UPI000408E3F0|nr:methyltransferase domain-containing protein [Niveispirillum irakense]